METALTSFSNELSKLVQQASSSVVAVHARRRFPSSGVHWGPDLVVTADHTISRDDDIRVTLPDGRSADATLLGRAPGADLAALKVPGLGAPAVAGSENEAAPVLGEFALVVWAPLEFFKC